VVLEAAALVPLPVLPAAQLLFLLGRLYILHTLAAQQVAVQATALSEVMDIGPYLTYCYSMEAVGEVVRVTPEVVEETVDVVDMVVEVEVEVEVLPAELEVPAVQVEMV
jgi:hypothetical protein